MYSVVTALVLWNFDYIYLLIVSAFYYPEMNPEKLMMSFVETLRSYRCERVWFPIIKGTLVGLFIPPLIDIVYSTVVALAMSIKEKGINFGDRFSWSFKIRDARDISLSLAKNWEDIQYWSSTGRLNLHSRILIFKAASYIEKNRVVMYNSKTNQLEYPSDKNDKILGVVYDLFPYNLALVVTGGSILDDSISTHFVGPEAGDWLLKLTEEGKLVVMEESEKNANIPAYASIRSAGGDFSKQNRIFIILNSSNDSKALNLSLSYRLFGED
ncbi:hypothetical protein V6Z05_00840 [Leptospira venezuelensis]|uniref:hypothetical protein n=2 Tax=Leptospira venezuelensis TaxID=1958811 RepID=UPI0012FF74F5|nr:hypothetical protein [Leptospira venezuelensis]